MNAKKLITQVRKHKGKLLAGISNGHDLMYVAVEKQDVIAMLEPFGDRESYFCLTTHHDNSVSIGVDHDAMQ